MHPEKALLNIETGVYEKTAGNGPSIIVQNTGKDDD